MADAAYQRPTSTRFSRTTVAAFLAVAVVYCWFAFVVVPTGAYWSPDSGYKHIQANNIRLTPWLDLTITYPGRWLDPNLKFMPLGREMFSLIKDQRIQLIQSPSVALLGKPFIALMGERGELVVPLLAGLLSVYLVGYFVTRADLGAAWAGLGILLAGIATPLLFYSLNFWEHTLGVALGLAGIVLIFDGSDSDQPLALRRYVLSGVLIGLAADVRKEMFIVGIAVGLSLLWYQRETRRGLMIWLCAFMLTWGVYLIGNHYSGGAVIETSVRNLEYYSVARSAILNQGPGIVLDYAFDPGYGSLGAILLILVAVYWCLSRRPLSGATICLQSAILLLTLLIVLAYAAQSGRVELRGILSVSPFLIIGLTTDSGTERQSRLLFRQLGFLIIAFYCLTILYLSLFTDGGPRQAAREWGTRYLLIIFPLAVPFVINGFQVLWRRGSQLAYQVLARLQLCLALGLVGVSIVVQQIGINQLVSADNHNLTLKAEILTLPEKQIVTDLWWLPVTASGLYDQKELFFADTPQLTRDWIRLAYQAGITHFAAVEFVPFNEQTLTFLAPPGTALKIVGRQNYYTIAQLMELEIVP